MKKQITILIILGFVFAAMLLSCGTASNGAAVEETPAAEVDGDDQAPADKPVAEETANPLALDGKIPPHVKKEKMKFEKPSDIVSESGGPCETDADCVKASCCHPRACVDKSQALDCEGMMCTMDCRAGTMDCGGGNCICRDGKCAVNWNAPKGPALKGPLKKQEAIEALKPE